MSTPRAIRPGWHGRLSAVRDEAIDVAIVLLALMALPALAADLVRAQKVGWQWAMSVHVCLTVTLWAVCIARGRIPPTIKACAALVSVFVVALSGLLTFGLASWGAAYFMALVLLTTLLFGQRWGIVALGASVVATSVLGIAVASRRLAFSIDLNAYNAAAVDWLQLPVLLTFIAATVLAVGGRLYAALENELSTSAERAVALRQSELGNRLLAENSTDVIMRLSPTLVVLYVSPAARQVLGFAPEQMVGRPAMAFANPEHRAAATQAVAQRLIEPSGEIPAFRHLRADGTYVWVEATGRAVRDEETGAVREIQVALRDISTRKRAEEVLREVAEDRLEQARVAEALSEASGALAAALEPAHVHDVILQQLARVVPCTTAQAFAYQQDWVVAVASYGEHQVPPGSKVAPLALASGVFPLTAEQARLLPDTRGAPGWQALPPWVGEHEVRSAVVVPLIVHGEIYGCLGVGNREPHAFGPRHFEVVRAFAERVGQALWHARLYELEQERASTAEHLASLRSDFVATVSHELRTPLAAVLGYAEVLEGRWDLLGDAQRKVHVQRIVTSANRQKRLIDDLLRVSTLEAERLEVHWQNLLLAPVVARAVEVVKASYPNQPIDVAGPQELVATADPSLTEQVLVNLLDNAAKYSVEGSPIELCWSEEEGMAVVRVLDHGPGISANGRGILFTRFGRIPGSRMRAGRVGTGLGLYLGRAYADAMGGTLEIESTGGSGSTFCFRLKTRRVEQA